jgi:hypothetical protein
MCVCAREKDGEQEKVVDVCVQDENACVCVSVL